MIQDEADRAGSAGEVSELSDADRIRADVARGKLESLVETARRAAEQAVRQAFDARARSRGLLWEPLDPYQLMWGVINVEGETACPIALFVHEEDAKGWIAQLTTDCDSDAYRGNPVYLKALPVRHLAGELRNSYEPVPAGDDESTPG